MFGLNGKTVLITGGSKGLGLTLSKGLARHGANVAIAARDEAALAQAKIEVAKEGGGWCRTFVFDLHEADQAQKLMDDVVFSAGAVDILVNCAGINKRGPAEDLDIAVLEEVFRVNVTAMFAMSQAFCRHRKALGQGGKIVNVGSLMCAGARPSTSPYTVSKGGVLALTKVLAVEWAKYGINVNAIGQGYFATDMTKPLRADEKFNSWVIGNTPMGRWGDPEDLVGATVFLASAASNFITGQIVYIDGGWLAGL